MKFDRALKRNLLSLIVGIVLKAHVTPFAVNFQMNIAS